MTLTNKLNMQTIEGGKQMLTKQLIVIIMTNGLHW